jgi:phosphate transport system permease protein
MIIFLFVASLPTIEKFGFNFLVNSHWDPVRDIYGAMPVIWGTVVSSFLAILFAAPISVGIALYLNEISNAGPARIIGFLVQV